LTANATTRIAISAAKKAVTATRKKYSASTCAACSDAAVGKNGKFVNIRLTASRLLVGVPLAAETDEQERQERADRRDEADPDRIEDRRPVLPGLRVVVVAEQQHLVAHRAEPVVRGLDQRQPQIARREIYPEQVARDNAARGGHVDRRAVRE